MSSLWLLIKHYFLKNKLKGILVNDYGNGCLQFICHTESQVDSINKMMTKQKNMPVGYEEWDEGEDKKWIMTWKIPQEYDGEIQYN